MGYRRGLHAVAAIAARAAHRAVVGAAHGWRGIRAAYDLRERHRHFSKRCGSVAVAGTVGVSLAYPAGFHDLSYLAVHAHGAHLERCRRAGLSVSFLPIG